MYYCYLFSFVSIRPHFSSLPKAPGNSVRQGFMEPGSWIPRIPLCWVNLLQGSSDVLAAHHHLPCYQVKQVTGVPRCEMLSFFQRIPHPFPWDSRSIATWVSALPFRSWSRTTPSITAKSAGLGCLASRRRCQCLPSWSPAC